MYFQLMYSPRSKWGLKDLCLLILLVVMIACNPTPKKDPPFDPECSTAREFDAHSGLSFPYAHQCNEVILDPNHINYQALKAYIQVKGFIKKETCSCGPHFELWGIPTNVSGVDVGTVVQQGPKTGGIGGGIFPNVLMGFPTPILPTAPKNLDTGVIPPECSFPDTVRIAIVDTGVDTIPSPGSNVLIRYDWNYFHNPPACLENANQFGLHLNPGFYNSEPRDHNGHGTSVNSVATGAASPGLSYNVPIEFINIGITEGPTKVGRLFDALCGLYYAIAQEPDIINISWGFQFHVNDSNNVIDSNITMVFDSFFSKAARYDILIVAGSGNDSMHLTNKHKFYPGCLAHKHPNGIGVGALKDIQPVPTRAVFSNFCDTLDDYVTLLAPGTRILCGFPEYIQIQMGLASEDISGTAYQYGTSFATPYVSRLAALIQSKNPSLTANEVKGLILSVTTIMKDDPSLELSKLRYRFVDPGLVKNLICPQP